MGYKSVLGLGSALMSVMISAQGWATDGSAEVAAREANLPPEDIILVTGRRMDQTLSDVAGSISVLTAEDIETQLVTNMSELFDRDPSLYVTGDVGEAQNIRVRGMGGDRILMIKDGMRLNEGYGASGLNDIVGRGFIDTENLKQVEVAKGAVSSLYGADALGGVVIFTTKDASDYLVDRDHYASVRAGFTSRSDEYNAGFTGAIRTGNFETLGIYTYRDGGEYKNHSDRQAALDITSHSGLLKTRYNFTNGDHLDLSAEYFTQDVDRPDSGQVNHGQWQNLPGYDITQRTSAEEKESSAFKISYGSERETRFFDYASISLYAQLSEQYNEQYMQLTIDSPYTPYKGTRDMWDYNTYRQETFGFVSSFTKDFATSIPQILGYGLDIETTKSWRTTTDYRVQAGAVIKDETIRPFPENDTLRIGAYVFDELSFMQGRLRLTPGARWDYYKLEPNNDLPGTAAQFEEISENRLSPNLGLVYDWRPGISVFAQYGEGFKVPPYDLAYIYHDNSIYGYKVIPSDDLSPETSRSYEIGLRRETARARLSLSAYYTDYEDFIDVERVGEEPSPYFPGSVVSIFKYRNIDAVTIQGVEASFEADLGRGFNAFGNIAWQTGEDQSSDVYLTTILPVNGTLGVGYQAQKWGGEIVTRWADDMQKIEQGWQDSEAWAVVDLTTHWQPVERLSLRAGVHNLFDTAYVEYPSVAGIAARDDLTQFERGGRAFTLNARLEF
ncbi:TonB-dependent hemoglobin/transferrin/lactoferrin family receptor [Woodsholea maritima]|uniref:TonB-dependent hemoglobin/transferrin/lactoferrin family receptor n=1 Tax=Woodsholea maritima TaxID=240237 RepID=UPI000362E8BA|nr:TonB-dependent hemoglobin/transferrin/lactoferrin family receptor [Woodsholea maritima]